MKLVCVESREHKYYLNVDNIVSVAALGSMIEILMVGGKTFRIPGSFDNIIPLLTKK